MSGSGLRAPRPPLRSLGFSHYFLKPLSTSRSRNKRLHVARADANGVSLDFSSWRMPEVVHRYEVNIL